MVKVELAVLRPEPSFVKVAGGAEPVMPDALLTANVTVPLKPPKPFTLTMVVESLLPREIVTPDWLRAIPKSGAAIRTEMVTLWLLLIPFRPSPVALTVMLPVVVPLTVNVSLAVGPVRSTVSLAGVHVRPAVALQVTSRRSW